VYSFSGRFESYEGILEVLRSGRTYTSPLLGLSWGDIYFFSLQAPLSETQIAIIIAVSLAIVPSALMMVRRYIYKRRIRSGSVDDN